MKYLFSLFVVLFCQSIWAADMYVPSASFDKQAEFKIFVIVIRDEGNSKFILSRAYDSLKTGPCKFSIASDGKAHFKFWNERSQYNEPSSLQIGGSPRSRILWMVGKNVQLIAPSPSPTLPGDNQNIEIWNRLWKDDPNLNF